MKEVWSSVFITPLIRFLENVVALLPGLLAMIVILCVGFVIAWAIKKAVFQILTEFKFDKFISQTGFTPALEKGGRPESASQFVSRGAYWVTALIFLMLGLQAMQLKPVDQFVAQIFSFLPNLFVACVILLVGFILANFLGRAALIAAVNAQMAQARLLARLVRLAVILFAVAMAFEQLGIAKMIIVAAFSIVFGGVVLSLAIAFGLGAKDAAKDLIDKQVKNQQDEKKDDFSHV